MRDGKGGELRPVTWEEAIGRIVEQLERPALSALGLLLIVIGAASGILWGGPLGWIAGIAVGAVGGWLVQKAIRRWVKIESGE